jgi:hypothetical protein
MPKRALAIVLLASSAHANYAFQGTLTVSGGYTTNAAGAAGNTPGNPADGLFLINPGVVFSSALPRAIQRISCNFLTQLYIEHPQLDSITNRLEYLGLFLPSRTTELQLSAYVLQSQINGANVEVNAGQVTRGGSEPFFGTGLTELFTWNLSQNLHLTQGAGFVAFIPTLAGVSPTYTGSLSLGVTRTWRRDSFAGNLQLGYFYYGETFNPVTNADGTVDATNIVAARQQANGQFLFEWRHDFQHFWTIRLAAGVATVFGISDDTQLWQPAGAAGVNYTHPKFQAELLYTRGIVPNPVVSHTFVSDTVALHGTVPFGEKSHMALSGGGSFAHYQEADFGATGTPVNVFFVDASLNYLPRDWLTIFVRYIYQNQLPEEGEQSEIPSLERHQVLLGLSIIYPPQGAVVVPNGPPIRVDRSDAISIPDVHSPTTR